MKAKRLLLAVLLAVVIQAGFSSMAMASYGGSSGIRAQTDSINAHFVCWYLEESEYDIGLALEKLSCDNIMLLSMLPEDSVHLHPAQVEHEMLEGDFWLVMEEPLHPYEPQSAGSPASGYSYSGGVEQWRGLVAKYFRSGDVGHALSVIDCETGGSGDPGELNDQGSGASGLFQHMPQYWAERSAKAGFEGASIFDPEANIAVAAWLAYSDGWHNWPNCG